MSNTLTLTGNLVADPEKVTFKDGKGKKQMLVNFRMGNNELVRGEPVSNGFFDVTVFGQQAEHVLKSIGKSERVVVTGRLQHSTWKADDGSTRGRTKIIAQAVALSLEFGRAKRKVEKKEG